MADTVHMNCFFIFHYSSQVLQYKVVSQGSPNVYLLFYACQPEIKHVFWSALYISDFTRLIIFSLPSLHTITGVRKGKLFVVEMLLIICSLTTKVTSARKVPNI